LAESFTVEIDTNTEFPILKLSGYCTEAAGRQAQGLLDPLLKAGKNRVIFDFSSCTLINSPGVVCISELVFQILDDWGGKSVFVGLDKLKLTLFKMTGLLPAIGTTDTIEHAQEALKNA
jgi:hypothetical protein